MTGITSSFIQTWDFFGHRFRAKKALGLDLLVTSRRACCRAQDSSSNCTLYVYPGFLDFQLQENPILVAFASARFTSSMNSPWVSSP